MLQYLLDYFRYTDYANRKMMAAFEGLPDKSEHLRIFSHLIHCQKKWLNRITLELDDNTLSWYGETYPLEELLPRWEECYGIWVHFLENMKDEDLESEFTFPRPDGVLMALKIKDIVFQLCCHSLHHRAQLNKEFRAQGIAPPNTDYLPFVIRQV